MKTFLFSGTCALVLCLAATAGASRRTSPKPEAASINPADIKWEPAPPALPKGGQVAVLHGNPFAKGVFALRLKAPDGYKIPPHWHTQDEQLSIVSGTMVLHMGDTMDAEAHALSAGAYHFLPGKMHHAAEARGETIVEIHGNGPFDIHYLNPEDDPSPKTAAVK